MEENFEFKRLIPKGEYIAAYAGYSLYTFINSPKIKLDFTIVEGDFTNVNVSRHYNVKRYNLEARSFIAKTQTCDFLVEYATCFPNQPIHRLDRVPMSSFENTNFRILMRDVDKSFRQNDLPPQLRYSVVERILGVATCIDTR